MINPSLIESAVFFFPIKTTHLLYRFLSYFHTSKDINHTNDVDVNNALPCLMPTSLRPKNITAVVAV